MKLHIEKLVHGGQGLARREGKVYFVWNALPGEEVEVQILKNKTDYVEAVAIDIITPSPERIEPLEAAYLSTSPWQILDPEREAYWKRAIARETFGKIGELILQAHEPEVINDQDNQYGYRNKIEFSFCVVDESGTVVQQPTRAQVEEKAAWERGPVSLAFFQRGKHKRIAVNDSALATPEINATAAHIFAWVQKQNIPIRSLKSLLVRSASHKTDSGETKETCVAALFIKDELDFPEYPTLTEELAGFRLYYSTHKSPASVPTKLLHSAGETSLTQNILGTDLTFGLQSFFQINVPIFVQALEDMAAFIDPKAPLIDLYSGVGAISLPLSMNRSETILVDSNAEAIEYAKKNITLNNLQNCRAECIPAEHITEIIDSEKILIVDPPRAGLHQDVVSRILAVQPPRIAYLSCNISTQARDIRMLAESYKPIFTKLYNFFPRTPHTESLVILERL